MAKQSQALLRKVKTYLRQIFQWAIALKKRKDKRKSSADGRHLRRPVGTFTKEQERKTKIMLHVLLKIFPKLMAEIHSYNSISARAL